jgi:hypothetical protein
MLRLSGTTSPGGTHRVAASVIAMVVLFTATPQTAAQQEGQPVRVARLIKSLGSSSYAQRRWADKQLTKIGAEGRCEIEQATKSDDPEIRLRARSLLKKLKVAELWAASPVSYRAVDTPASNAVRVLAEQTGNRLSVGDQFRTFEDKKITLSHSQGTFWQVVDDLCRKSGNRVRRHYDSRKGGLVVVSGNPGKFPLAYAGPLRARITSARRAFSEDFDYEDESSDTAHTFEFNLQALWEDRFQLMAYRTQPVLVAAITDSGDELAAAEPSDKSWNVTGRSTRQFSTTLALHPPAVACRHMKVLALRWDLIAVGDMAVYKATDLSAGKSYRRENMTLKIDSIEHSSNTEHTVTVIVLRDLVIPEAYEVLFHENRVELLDSDGVEMLRRSQTATRIEGGVKLKIMFQAKTKDAKPTTLRLHYPKIRSQRELEIVFRDVPLPVAKPD